LKFQVFGDYDVGVNTFWDHVFFVPEFINELYRVGLNFERHEILSEKIEDNGHRERSLKAYPNFDLPAPLRKHMGSQFHYIERGRYDRVGQRWITDIHIPKFGQKLTIRSTMSFRPNGGNRSIRHVEFDVNVNVFGFRRLLEPFLERTLKETYERARIVTNDWIHANLPADVRHQAGHAP